jgi:hypothetical protein
MLWRSRGSGPAITDMISATSPTVRVIGPICSIDSQPERPGNRSSILGFQHTIPARFGPAGRDLALRGLVAIVVAVELTTVLCRRGADNDHQNKGGGSNHKMPRVRTVRVAQRLFLAWASFCFRVGAAWAVSQFEFSGLPSDCCRRSKSAACSAIVRQ